MSVPRDIDLNTLNNSSAATNMHSYMDGVFREGYKIINTYLSPAIKQTQVIVEQTIEKSSPQWWLNAVAVTGMGYAKALGLTLFGGAKAAASLAGTTIVQGVQLIASSLVTAATSLSA